MDKFRVSVKGIVVDENHNMLVLKREERDVHLPGAWEPPGGRLEIGEDPFLGMKREVKEETGLDIGVGEPLTVRHFTRQDGQVVTMLTFICKPDGKEISLSGEHTDFKWIDLKEKDEKLVEYLGYDAFFMKEVEAYRKRFMS